jgi:hypothetical protein
VTGDSSSNLSEAFLLVVVEACVVTVRQAKDFILGLATDLLKAAVRWWDSARLGPLPE